MSREAGGGVDFWAVAYDGAGNLVSVPHELFGRKMPRVRIASFPVRTRYGLIWIFPGDPARAEEVPMPELPELEGGEAWACAPLDFTWQAHHSLIIENVSDFTHAHLHRKYRPFSSAKLVDYEPGGNQVRLNYDVLVGDGRWSRHFVDRRRIDVNRMELCFAYPHQWSNTDDKIKHWCFVLPLDELQLKELNSTIDKEQGLYEQLIGMPKTPAAKKALVEGYVVLSGLARDVLNTSNALIDREVESMRRLAHAL